MSVPTPVAVGVLKLDENAVPATVAGDRLLLGPGIAFASFGRGPHALASFLRLLARRGYAVPETMLLRDVTQPVGESAEVQEADEPAATMEEC